MTGLPAPAPRLLLLGLALASLACGTTKKGAPTDGAAGTDGPPDDVVSCGGKPSVGCVAGAASDADGVWCGDFVMPASCRDDQWSCPSGMVFESDCTCGFPGISCTPQICTAAGPVCLDAGTTPDADHDGSTDGASCGDAAANPYCTQTLSMPLPGIPVACGDYSKPATCVGTQWTCNPGWVYPSTCNCSGLPPPDCVPRCTPEGMVCTGGGADSGLGG